MQHRRLSYVVSAFLGMLLTAGCENWAPEELLGIRAEPVAKATQTPLPASTQTPRPAPATATPTPEPATGQQLTQGSAVLRIRGIDRLPLHAQFDYVVAATLTWELEGANKKVPISEISIRGIRPRPCMERPCGDDAGLVVRVTANADYDGSQHDESKHCGAGTNYHQRLAIGKLGSDGGIDVVLEWNSSGLKASTPVDSVFIPAARMAGSFGFGRVLEGAPFSHSERGYGWDSLSINKFGGSTELKEFNGTPGNLRRCP